MSCRRILTGIVKLGSDRGGMGLEKGGRGASGVSKSFGAFGESLYMPPKVFSEVSMPLYATKKFSRQDLSLKCMPIFRIKT